MSSEQADAMAAMADEIVILHRLIDRMRTVLSEISVEELMTRLPGQAGKSPQTALQNIRQLIQGFRCSPRSCPGGRDDSSNPPLSQTMRKRQARGEDLGAALRRPEVRVKARRARKAKAAKKRARKEGGTT